MVRLWGCVLLAGCGFSSPRQSGEPSDAATGGDAGDAVDSPPATCNGISYGEAPFTVCLSAVPTGMISLLSSGRAMIDTDACASTLPLGTGQKIAQAQTGAPAAASRRAGATALRWTGEAREAPPRFP